MRIVIQRVSHGQVTINNAVYGEIRRGIVALVGINQGDDEKAMQYMLDKITGLRIFEDENDKMNNSLLDIGGELLIIPNFTIYADARSGRRPSFSRGAAPQYAKGIFEELCTLAKALPIHCEFGVFQADMKVAITNDGPVTIILDSDKII